MAKNVLLLRSILIIFRDKEVDKKSNVQKLHIAGSDKPVAFYSLDVILAEFVGTTLFKARMFRNVFRDKILKLDSDSERAKGTQSINLSEKDWYAQNELYEKGGE